MDHQSAFPEAFAIVDRLRTAGYKAYWVGGCVRDLLLERTPKDIDVATAATPSEVLALFPEAKPVGASFGVMLLGKVEIATFRSDCAYADGRRPEAVRYETDPKEDAARRDFTINGMFLDPVSGEVLDFFDGQRDLVAGVVRAIGDASERFEEDHLRMLRAVRFAARLGFTIESGTWNAIQANAQKIERIAAERVREELTRMLTEGGAKRALEMLAGTGLLREVLPEIEAMRGVEQPPEHHPEGDVFTHTCLMLDLLTPPVARTLAWGVLLHDVGKPVTQTFGDRIRFNGHVEAGLRIAAPLLQRLRFSSDDQEQILRLVEHHMRFAEAPRMKASTWKRFLRLDRFEEHLELHRVDCTSSSGHLENYELMKQRWEEAEPEVARPVLLVTGNDLIAAGYTPSKAFGNALRVLEDAQLNGEITTREEGLALAARVLGERA
jgi:poly(A) polymerase